MGLAYLFCEEKLRELGLVILKKRILWGRPNSSLAGHMRDPVRLFTVVHSRTIGNNRHKLK